MQVNLVFPPHWSYDEPYLAIPSLVGHLAPRGVETRVFDLNVQAADRCFSAAFMDECARRLRARLSSEPSAVDLLGTPLGHHLAAAEVVGRRVEACKAVLRAECQPDRTGPARSVLDQAAEVASAAFASANEAAISGTLDMAAARRACSDDATNSFSALFGQADFDDVLAGNPDLVGVSVTGMAQLVPTLTLVQRLKATAPDIPIVLGGALSILITEVALRHPELFDGIDFLIAGEGETALTHLLDALAGRRPMEQVENLYFRRGGRFVPGRIGFLEDVDQLEPPDFTWSRWESYLSPVRIVPYQSSRGCYWDRCTFCAYCATVMNNYRQRSMDKVIDDLRHLRSAVESELFFFTDECVSPSRLRGLSKALLDADLEIEWDMLARFEKGFKPPDFELGARAGLNLVSWGLESASPPLLERMDKGIDPEIAGRLLDHSHAAGLWNNVFVIFGFPGETDADHGRTKDFIRRNAGHIDSLTYSAFVLEKGARIHMHASEHGIIPNDSGTCVGQVPFDYEPPMSHARVQQRYADLEGFLRNETHLSTIFVGGMSWGNLKVALHQLGSKAALRRYLQEVAEYFRQIFCDDGWVVTRFVSTPTERRRTPDGHGVVFSETTGTFAALNASGLELLDLMAEPASLREALCRMGGAEPSGAELTAALPILRGLVWRGLVAPDANDSLRRPEVVDIPLP